MIKALIHVTLSNSDCSSYFSVMFLQKRLKNLRDMLKKCLDKRNRQSRSDAAARDLPRCRYFEHMAFLCETSANKPTESNLPSDSPSMCSLGGPLSEDSVVTPMSPISVSEAITEPPSRLPHQIGKERGILRIQN